MNVHSIYARNLEEIALELQETIASRFQPTLAIVFASVKQELAELGQIFKNHNITVFGGTTAGEFRNDEVGEGSIVVMLLDLKKDYFRLEVKEANYETTYQMAQQIAEGAKAAFENPAFITLFSITICGDKLITGIEDQFDEKITIFGGMAGNDTVIDDTYVFTNDKVLSNGLLALILDNDKIAVNGLATSGWEAIGVAHTITKSEGNRIYTINDEPALDVFLKFFGFYERFGEVNGAIHKNSALYPLQLIRNGSYVLRTHIEANEEERSLVLIGSVKQGEQFKFSIAPGFEVIEETVKQYKDFHQVNEEVDAVILFSCKARHMSLGPLITDEVEGIYNIYKKPLIGFFCYGELGQGENKQTNYYNQTCSLVTLKERK